MKTQIIQSYRKSDVPRWISLCLASVKSWAESRGFGYRFVGDEFFDYAPPWVRDRCADQFFSITDVARLYLIRESLNSGYDRVVWLDADIVLFDPANLSIDTSAGYAFCHEAMMGSRPDGSLEISGWSINNAAIVMHRGHPMLDFYIFAAEAIIRETAKEKFFRTMIGPAFLTRLSQTMPVERITGLALFTPAYLQQLLRGNVAALSAYRQRFGFPIAGANLCHFMRHDADAAEKNNFDRMFEAAVEMLVASKGGAVNAVEEQRGAGGAPRDLLGQNNQHMTWRGSS